jgi:hypothetical protein
VASYTAVTGPNPRFKPKLSGLPNSNRTDAFAPPSFVATLRVPASWNTRRSTAGALVFTTFATRASRSAARASGVSTADAAAVAAPAGTIAAGEASAAAASAKSSRRAKRAGAAADAASSPSTATPRSTRVGSVARPDPEAESAVEATRHEDVARGEGRRVFEDADLCARRARGASSGDGPAKRAADDITSSRSTNAFPREGGECQVARVRL